MSDTILGSTATTASLALNSSTRSTIDSRGDQDWFRIYLTDDTTYTFRQNRASGSNLDTFLSIYNANGLQVANNDDISTSNRNSLITFTPDTSGFYYVAAGGYSSSTGAYSVSATATSSTPSNTTAPTPPPTTGNDIAGSTATTASLALNSSTRSTIDSLGDQDWFRIYLTDDTTYTFRQDKASGSILDTLLRIYNANGLQVANNDDISTSNWNSLITFTPDTSGFYFVAAGGYSSSTGAYSISATATSSTPSDTTAPTLSSLSPADESTNVAADRNIVLTFNEAVRAGSGNITITNLTAGGSRTISVTDTSQISFSGRMMTIDPTQDLLNDWADWTAPGASSYIPPIIDSVADLPSQPIANQFMVTFGSSVVKGAAGNSFSGLNSGTLNFTSKDVNLYWCTRDLQATGLGNHHFLWIDGDATAIRNETNFDGNLALGETGRWGYVLGATDGDGTLGTTDNTGFLTAYSSENIRGEGEAGSAAGADYEAIREVLTNRSIGWTNDDLEIRQITCRDGRSMDTVVTELFAAWENYRSYEDEIVFDLGGADRSLGVNSGNCASWINTIVDVVGLNLPSRFGDFSMIDWGEDHVINLSAFA